MSWFQDPSPRSSIQNRKTQAPDPKYWILNSESRIQDPKCQIPKNLVKIEILGVQKFQKLKFGSQKICVPKKDVVMGLGLSKPIIQPTQLLAEMWQLI